jgi:single-stranded-DNA-specific exonuclease
MLSFSQKKWIFQETDDFKVLEICQKYGVTDLIARILAARKLPVEDITNFLDPKIRNMLPDPFVLNDMEKAVERTLKAIKNTEKITIYGDYDVDGATSVSLLVLYFRALGITVDYYIPDRITEGYGMNKKALQLIKNNATSLIIVVDCGTTSVEEIKYVRENSMDTIILDHHAAGTALPQTLVVNPHRTDQVPSPAICNLCAAGVVFLFLVGVQRGLRESHSFGKTNLPDLMQFLDLVALGTVCDVMPLLGLNRAFVCRGLELMQRRKNIGINALIETAGLGAKISSYHLGFALGPRINAGGRIGSSTLGAQLLTTLSEKDAASIAAELHQLNCERQLLEKMSIDQAVAQIEEQKLHENPVVLTGHHEWHAGVIGIMASRLKEKYHKPVLVYSLEGDYAKGSCRSVEGLDIGKIVHKAIEAGILVSGGGHAMAAGFSFYKGKEAELQEFLNANAKDFMASYIPAIKIDAEISLSGVTMALIESLEQLEPLGVSNPAPIFCIRNVRAAASNVANGGHIQCRLKDESGNFVQAISFKSDGTQLGQALTSGNTIDIAGTLKKNTWNGGDKPQVIIEDAAIPCHEKH